MVAAEKEGIGEERIARLQSLLASVKEKTLQMRAQRCFFRSLNFKLTAFLKSFDEYSEEVVVSECKAAERNRGEKRIKREETSTSHPIVDLRSVVSVLFPDNRANKKIAVEIFDLLERNGTTSLDDIVKGIKQSKYRVITVLNILVKERLVTKFFEKGFNYKLSGRCET